MRDILFFMLKFALLVALSACTSADDVPTIGGTYVGESGTSYGQVTLIIPNGTVSDSDTKFQGKIDDEDGSPMNYTGIYDHPSLSIDINGVTVNTVVSDDGDTITITDSVFNTTYSLKR